MCLSLVRCVQVDSLNTLRCCLTYLFELQKCYASIVEDLNFSDTECLKYSLSKGLGVGIVVGGSIVKLPQVLLSMQSVRDISLPSKTDGFPSLVRPFCSRNFSELLHSRNLLLPRDMRVLISQRVPILNLRGEHLLGTTKHLHHPSHHLFPLLHATEISIFS